MHVNANTIEANYSKEFVFNFESTLYFWGIKYPMRKWLTLFQISSNIYLRYLPLYTDTYMKSVGFVINIRQDYFQFYRPRQISSIEIFLNFKTYIWKLSQTQKKNFFSNIYSQVYNVLNKYLQKYYWNIIIPVLFVSVIFNIIQYSFVSDRPYINSTSLSMLLQDIGNHVSSEAIFCSSM